MDILLQTNVNEQLLKTKPDLTNLRMSVGTDIEKRF